jgi:hypothetical protein
LVNPLEAPPNIINAKAKMLPLTVLLIVFVNSKIAKTIQIAKNNNPAVFFSYAFSLLNK